MKPSVASSEYGTWRVSAELRTREEAERGEVEQPGEQPENAERQSEAR